MLLYIYVIFTLCGFSMSDGDHRAMALLTAKSAKDLKVAANSFDQFAESKSRCEFEIKAKIIPVSCYEYTHLNKKSLTTGELKNQIQKLDELCTESMSKKKVDALRTTYLSTSCKKIVERQNQEIDYIQKEQNPYEYVISP